MSAIKVAATLSTAVMLFAAPMRAVAAVPTAESYKPSAQGREKQGFLGEMNASCYYDDLNIVVNWSAETYRSFLSVVGGDVVFVGETQFLGGFPSGLHVGGRLKRAEGQLVFYAGPVLPESLRFVLFENQWMRTIESYGEFPDTILDCTYEPGRTR